MDSLKKLVDAIDMIVTAPYSVDITSLYVVVRRVDDEAIHQWCCVKACQIPKLAAYLVKSLIDERAMEMFERFSRAMQFSKHLVECRPNLLPRLIGRAIEEDDDRHLDLVCCRLLGARIMQTGIPAGFPQFLEKLMRADYFSSNNADLLRGLREIIATQSAWVFLLVDQVLLTDFVKACNILTADGIHNNHEGAIVSINIGTAVCNLMCPKDFVLPQQSTVAPQVYKRLEEWSTKMSPYLYGPKAARFLHSIAARVMFFTSRNHNISMLSRSRTLDIVLETLERFRYGLKQFADENPAAVEKLWRNTAGKELNFDARFSAFAVAYNLTPEGAYPDHIEGVLQQLVTVIASKNGPSSMCSDRNALCKAQQFTNALCFLLQDDRKLCLEMLHQVMDFILAQCKVCEQPDAETYNKTSLALVLLDALSESMKKHQRVFALFLGILDKPGVLEERLPWLQTLPSTLEPLPKAHCRGNLVCAQELYRLGDRLRHNFIIVCLQGACTTTGTLSITDFTLLQNKAQYYNPQLHHKRCQYPADVDLTAFMPPLSHPPRVEGDWRQQLVDILDNVQRQSTHTVLNQVNSVCHEFEARCQTVEEPLRQAESQAAQLREQLDRTRSRLEQQEATNAVLMETVKADGVAMDAQDVEVIALNDHITQLQDAAKQQNDKIAQLMADITSLKLEHDNHIKVLRTEATTTEQDLELLNKATRFGLEEQIDIEKEHAVTLAATIKWLELESLRLQEEQKTDHKNYEESVEQLKLEHQQAYNNATEQVSQLEIKLNVKTVEVTKLMQAMKECGEDLQGMAMRLQVCEQSERESKQENLKLQERLRVAEEKEKKVLAAISGKGHD